MVNNKDINADRPGMLIDKVYHKTEDTNYLGFNCQIYRYSGQYYLKAFNVEYLKSSRNSNTCIDKEFWIKIP